MPSVDAVDLKGLLVHIRSDYPDLSFVESDQFSWHSGKKYVSFSRLGTDAEHDMWTLLHELGHALLGHTSYRYDIELLQLESAAWEKACELAITYALHINESYMQNCLDSYRDWLHLRATCPTCFARSLQASQSRYHCFNCGAEWRVSRSRLCRPYRLQNARQ